MEKIDISIVIPSYNESKRLKRFLPEVISFCTNSKRQYEIIVIDDGSSDGTYEIALSFKSDYPKLDVIRNLKNIGKGYAVKRGILRAKGDICVFFDADGSTKPDEIEKNIHFILDGGYDIFTGSRVIKDRDRVVKGKLYRKIIGTIFNFFVHIFLFKNIEDTQCGFKMFKKSIVVPLFSRIHIKDFGFDIEVLYLAYKMGYKIKEGPISWHHVKGSKINLFTDSIKMFINILQVRNWHYTSINYSDKYLGPNEYEFMFNIELYHWWYVNRKKLILKLLYLTNISSPKILDVGMGTGGNLLEFSKLGQAFGIDVSEKAIEFCRKRNIKYICQSPAEKLPFKDKTFDIITCLDVLEHVPEPVETLLELRRVIKDNGKIIITVPTFKILYTQRDEELYHLRHYEIKSLTDDINEAKLKVEKMNYFFLILFFVITPVMILSKLFYEKYAYSNATTVPPKLINEILKILFKLETSLSIKLRFPMGSSLYAVASKEN